MSVDAITVEVVEGEGPSWTIRVTQSHSTHANLGLSVLLPGRFLLRDAAVSAAEGLALAYRVGGQQAEVVSVAPTTA